jgi:chromosome segregation ATPase
MNVLLQLSQLQQSGMSTTWTTADLITIGAIAVAFGSAWLKMLINKTKLESTIESLKSALAQETAQRIEKDNEAIASKSTIKRELNEKLDAEVGIIHKRIERTQKHHEAFTKQTDQEFKAINSNLGEIKGQLGQILGKLSK